MDLKWVYGAKCCGRLAPVASWGCGSVRGLWGGINTGILPLRLRSGSG
jgi:hypothetical protein